MQKHNLLGKYVSITVLGWEGRKGIVTSIGNEVLPIHVTLDGEEWETDFTADEVKLIWTSVQGATVAHGVSQAT